MGRTDVATYLDLPYLIEIDQEQYEDGRICYLARHPELPGCMSHGDTREEAVASLRDARELYIASLLDDGLEVPLPHASPAHDHGAPSRSRVEGATGPTR